MLFFEAIERGKRTRGPKNSDCYIVRLDCLDLELLHFIIKFPYNARSDWLKQRTLSENKEQVNDRH